MTDTTMRLAVALAALILAGPTSLQAQTGDAGTVTCAELMAMDQAAQMAFLRSLIAAAANALDLNDLVVAGAMPGPMRDACAANPDRLALDAAMSMRN